MPATVHRSNSYAMQLNNVLTFNLNKLMNLKEEQEVTVDNEDNDIDN